MQKLKGKKKVEGGKKEGEAVLVEKGARSERTNLCIALLVGYEEPVQLWPWQRRRQAERVHILK